MVEIKLRKAQEIAINEIMNSYDNNKYFFINMPTGGGKTLTVLMLYKRIQEVEKERVYMIVATRTKNEFNPYFRDIVKFQLDINPLGIAGKEEMCNEQALRVILEELEDISPCKMCDKRVCLLEYAKIREGILGHQSITWLKNINDICPYYSLRQHIKVADITCVTYPYIFTPRINLIAQELRDELSKPSNKIVLVIDEGHNVDNVGQQYERKLNYYWVQRVVELIEKNELMLPLTEYIQLRDFIAQKMSEKENHIRKEEIPEINTEVLREEIEALSYDLLEESSRKKLRVLLPILRFYELLWDENLEVFSYKDGIKLRAILPTPIIQRYVTWFDKAIIMSGTLQPYDYIKNIWKLEGKYIDVEEYCVELLKNREGYLVTTLTTKYKYRQANYPRYAQAIEKIHKEFDTIKLVVFPSYEVMNEVLKRINEEILRQSVIETEGTKIEEVQKEVMDNGKRLIMAVAGGKLTEGVEVTKNGKSLIEDVLLCGIPYPEVSPYMMIKAQRISQLLNGNVDLFRYLYHVPALVQVKQAIGRAVRSEKDKARIWLLDSRYRYMVDELKVRMPTMSLI